MRSALHPAQPRPAPEPFHGARQRPAFSFVSIPHLLVALATVLFLSCAAAQNNDVSLVLPRGTLLNTLTDAQANAVLATYGYVRPPYAGTVYEIRTTESTQLVRTYLYDATDPFNPSGRWTMRALNLRGLTPDQIKDFYALPTAVNRVTIVQVPTGTRVYAGYAGPLSDWGAGGGPQTFLFDRPPFSNYQPQATLTADTFYYAPRSGGSNAGQVADYLDHQLPTPFADLETVYLSLDVLNLNAAADPRSALNQLTGEAHTALGAVSGYAAQGVGRTLLDRMRGPGSAVTSQRTVLSSLAAAAASDARPAPANQPRQDTWAQLVGTWGRVGDEGGAAGYGYQTRGVLAGRDLGSGALDWGIAAGYMQSRVGFNRDADRGTVNSLQLAAYGERSRAQARLRGVLGFSYDDYDAERHLSFLGRTATATYRGYNVHGAVELGWPGAFAAANVEPFVAATGVYSRRNGFSELGAGDASLVADAATQRSLALGAGVRVSHNMETAGVRITPRLALGITREVLDRAPGSDVRLAGAAGTFPVTGAAPGREALSLSASLDVRVRKNVNAYIGYQAQARHNLTEQGLVAGLAASW